MRVTLLGRNGSEQRFYDRPLQLGHTLLGYPRAPFLRRTSGPLLCMCACAVLSAALTGCSSSSHSPHLDSSSRASLGSNLLGADSSSSHDSSLATRRFVKADGTVIEVESSEAEARKAVTAQPTSFELSFPDATYGWERAKVFFLRFTSSYRTQPLYADGGTTQLSPSSKAAPSKGSAVKSPQRSAGLPRTNDESLLISNALSTNDSFLFEVRRSPGKVGWVFTVSTRPHPRHQKQAPSASIGQAGIGQAGSGQGRVGQGASPAKVVPAAPSAQVNQHCRLLAQNLARFIKSGELDTELLTAKSS